MTTALARALPTPEPAEPRRLRSVEVGSTRRQRRARPRTVYAVTTMIGVLAILTAQLLTSIVLSQGAYEISELQADRKQLDRTAEGLTERLDVLSSPQQLAASAQALGMRTASTPAFLSLSDGAVLGAPIGARGDAVGGAGALVANSLLAGVTAPDEATAAAEAAVTAPQPGAWVVAGEPASTSAGAPAVTGVGESVASGPNTLPTPTTR